MESENFCFCLKLDSGCLLLGVTTAMLSFFKIVITAVCMLPQQSTLAPNVTVPNVTYCGTDKSVTTVVGTLVLIACLLWMMISVLLVIGIVKGKAGFVQTYFLFGVALCIKFLLSSLLQVISGFWIPSVLTFILTLAYIMCLTSVYAKMRQLTTDDKLYPLITDREPMIDC